MKYVGYHIHWNYNATSSWKALMENGFYEMWINAFPWNETVGNFRHEIKTNIKNESRSIPEAYSQPKYLRLSI